MTYYSLEAVENLMDNYFEKGAEVVTIEEGSLGVGTVVCFGEGLKTIVIKEKYLNCWSSTHTIRMYNSMPKKYEILIDKVLSGIE